MADIKKNAFELNDDELENAAGGRGAQGQNKKVEDPSNPFEQTKSAEDQYIDENLQNNENV